MASFHYWAFGLCLTCDQPLEGLVKAPQDAEPDLWVWLDDESHQDVDDLRSPPAWRLVREQPPITAWVAPSPAGPTFRLRFGTEARHIEFTITRSGSQIRTRRTEGCTIADVEALLLGPVLTCTLRARGVTCLHGSVVAIGDFAVVLIGQSGAGKSTTAAGLLRLGARPLSDDLAVVVEREGRFLVHQGSHRLRLHPDAAEALGAGNELPRVWPDLPDRPQRRYLGVPNEAADSAAPSPVPLAAIYIVSERDAKIEEIVIEPLSAARGLAALLSNASASFMLPELEPRPEFDQLGRIAHAVPIRAMRRGEGLERLDAVCRAIHDDAVRLARRSKPILV
jgi:hypothetical protein